MANASKDKGDRGEREAVAALLELLPGVLGEHAGRLMEINPQRKLGAGRKEDTGDLWVLRDVAIQAKNWADLFGAIRAAAIDAQIQAGHGLLPYAVGISKIENVRIGNVRWLASCLFWPVELEEDCVAVFHNPASAVTHVRNDRIGVPRRRRVTRIEKTGKEVIWLAPIEAWIAAYAQAAVAPAVSPEPESAYAQVAVAS